MTEATTAAAGEAVPENIELQLCWSHTSSDLDGHYTAPCADDDATCRLHLTPRRRQHVGMGCHRRRLRDFAQLWTNGRTRIFGAARCEGGGARLVRGD